MIHNYNYSNYWKQIDLLISLANTRNELYELCTQQKILTDADIPYQTQLSITDALYTDALKICTY